MLGGILQRSFCRRMKLRPNRVASGETRGRRNLKGKSFLSNVVPQIILLLFNPGALNNLKYTWESTES